MNHDVLTALDALRAAGAARFDPVSWHYMQTLAERAQAQGGPAQALLEGKLQVAMRDIQSRMDAAAMATTPAAVPSPPSALTALLQDMRTYCQPSDQADGWPAENPRIQQFRKQLSRISVQKQVKQAIALAPANAGPINSHMLVLRSLGLMRDISPDYLNRFMAYVDTLLCLDEADKGKALPKKAASAGKTKSA